MQHRFDQTDDTSPAFWIPCAASCGSTALSPGLWHCAHVWLSHCQRCVDKLLESLATAECLDQQHALLGTFAAEVEASAHLRKGLYEASRGQ